MYVIRCNYPSARKGEVPLPAEPDEQLQAAREEGEQDDPRLTRREIECLQALARGLYDAQIALELDISHSTIRLHLKNARTKLKSRTREQALVKAAALGLIKP